MYKLLKVEESSAPRSKSFSVWALLMVLLALFSLPLQPAFAALTDTTPPVLKSFDFDPKAIDVSSAAATFTATMHVTDDLSGFSFGYFYIYSPSFGQNAVGYCYLSTGTPLDGDAQCIVNIPQNAEAGNWVINFISIGDNTGNYQTIDTATLTSLTFPTVLSVTSSAPDITPPQLSSFSLAPAAIDVSSGPQSVTFMLGATDAQTGVDISCQVRCYYTIELRSPSGLQLQREIDYNVQQLSGSPQDGIWQLAVTLPQYAEAGIWTVSYLVLHDLVGNVQFFSSTDLQGRGFPTAFSVMSAPSDTQPPQLTSLTFTPNFVDTTASSRLINLTAGMVDNLSGLNFSYTGKSPGLGNNYGYFYFRSPSGNQSMYVFVQEPRLAGTPLNGTWQGTGYLPQYSEAGTWSLTNVYFYDLAGNLASYSQAQLTTLGFPTTLAVILPSLAIDGTLPISGGTVMDDVFGNRATVTVPPGILTLPTTVSIDVLSSDLHLPIPAGFTTNGTNFVNIKLVPEPTPPFPAPGLTIVLPLLSQMAPGSSLTLYRVDPASGNLIPEPGVGGGPAMGTVNADEFSATFTGVASLSTVVGLIRSSAVLGDVNGDGKVNCADIAIVRAAFGKKLGQSGFDNRADTNHDKVVNVRDLAYVSRYLPKGLVCRITPAGAVQVAPARAVAARALSTRK